MDVNRTLAIGTTISTAGAVSAAAALFCLTKNTGTIAIFTLALLSVFLFLAGTAIKWRATQ